jgi:hypothetical protein
VIAFGIGAAVMAFAGVYGVASMFDTNEKQPPQAEYITEEDFVNNQRTAQALKQFFDRLKHTIPNAVQGILNIAIVNIIKPVEAEISAQRELIKQMKDDLKKTVDGQSATRNQLSSLASEAASIRQSYNDIYQVVTSI